MKNTQTPILMDRRRKRKKKSDRVEDGQEDPAQNKVGNSRNLPVNPDRVAKMMSESREHDLNTI